MKLGEIKGFVESNAVIIATADKEANPHVIVVDGVKVVEGKVIFTDNYMEKTKKNIVENRKIELLVYDKNWKGYLIEGSSEYHDSGKWLDFVKGLEQNKAHPAKGAILVNVEKIIRKE